MNKALTRILATVMATAMLLGFVGIFHVTAAPQSTPQPNVTVPALFLAGSSGNLHDTFLTGALGNASGTHTIDAWIETSSAEGGWAGAFYYDNANKCHRHSCICKFKRMQLLDV